jgi:hypothetical protein
MLIASIGSAVAFTILGLILGGIGVYVCIMLMFAGYFK